MIVRSVFVMVLVFNIGRYLSFHVKNKPLPDQRTIELYQCAHRMDFKRATETSSKAIQDKTKGVPVAPHLMQVSPNDPDYQ
jgi:hypothetical protein